MASIIGGLQSKVSLIFCLFEIPQCSSLIHYNNWVALFQHCPCRSKLTKIKHWNVDRWSKQLAGDRVTIPWDMIALFATDDPWLLSYLHLSASLEKKERKQELLVLALQAVGLHNVLPYFIKHPIDNPTALALLIELHLGPSSYQKFLSGT